VKTKVSPTVIGLFVLGALLLAVVALFSFGGVNFFSKPERFIVYFDESIHGLDDGSPVKLRGVRIGRVVGLKVRATPGDPAANKQPGSLVAVVCELSRNVVADGLGAPIDVSDRAELQRLIDSGLRAQLGVIGYATGLLYVELDFYDPAAYPFIPRADVESTYLEMPAVPSKSAEFLRNLDEILTNIKDVDFPGIAAEARNLLADTRAQVKAADLGAISREWSAAGRSVSALAESPELKALLANAASASARLDRVLADLEKVSGPGAEHLNLALQDARDAMRQLTETTTVMKRFINAQQHLGDDASKALSRLGEAASAVGRLADFLERNPNALLSGRAVDAKK
jgi:paraquat-inducible protein B